MTEEAMTESKTGFRRYDHVERLGHTEVEGLTFGKVYVFPKLDGTNASVWWDGEHAAFGSRNRTITPEDDNAGFAAWASEEGHLLFAVEAHPSWILYGEWMVPHTLKTYRDDVWRRLWIFDVYDRATKRYLPYDEYAAALAGLDVVEPLCIISEPSDEQLARQVETNTYMIRDGGGLGEGVVFKNYEWRNVYGRQPWAKIVRNEFKEENRRAFGITEKDGEFSVELAIAEKYVTPALVGKTLAKVLLDVANAEGIDTSHPNWQQRTRETHRGKVIPQLLSRTYHDLIVEEFWDALKEYGKTYPVVNFKILNGRVVARIKALAPEMF